MLPPLGDNPERREEEGGDLEELASRAARELLEARPGLRDASPIELNFAIGEAISTFEGSAARLAEVCSSDPCLKKLCEGWIQQPGGAGAQVRTHAVPRLLIRSALQGDSVASVIKEAQSFAESLASTAESYSALAGVNVKEALRLDTNVDLIPWTDVPKNNIRPSSFRSHRRSWELQKTLQIPQFEAAPRKDEFYFRR